MVALAVVVLDVLPREEAQVTLTEWDHTSEHSSLIDRTNRSAYASAVCNSAEWALRQFQYRHFEAGLQDEIESLAIEEG